MKRIVALFLIAFLSLQIFPTQVWAATEKSTLLKDKLIVVSQDNVDLSDTTPIDTSKAFKVSLSFGVPVKGDWSNGTAPVGEYIEQGDTADLRITDQNFKLTSTPSVELKKDGVLIGSVTLSGGGETQPLTAHVEFNGAPEVFSGEPQGAQDPWHEVKCTFSCILEYVNDVNPNDTGDKTVTILGKSYTIHVPEPATVVTGSKTGVRSGQFIDWTVEANATKGTQPADISGYIFSDNLTNVGEYVSDSLKIGVDETTALTVMPDASALANKTLQYVFPNDTKGTQKVFFRTRISDDLFYANGAHTVKNTAEILHQDKVLCKMTGQVDFTVQWIQKNVGEIDHNAGTITWTVTANQLGATLPNAVITDTLNSKLAFKEAKCDVKGADGNWSSLKAFSTEPDNGRYELGTISAPVMLTLTATVKPDYDTKHTVQTVSNTATLSWDGHAGIGSNSVTANIGMNPITKEAGTYTAQTHEIPWTVSVKQSDMNTDLKVYDLLVYANSGFDAENNTYTLDRDEGINADIPDAVFKRLKPRYKQQYKLNSFSNTSELALTKYTVKHNGTAVADLLVVTGQDGNGFGVADGTKAFSYTSVVTDPKVYLGNGTQNIYNTAGLFSANNWVNEASAICECSSKMLNKTALTREAAAQDLTQLDNANANASDMSQIFDYDNKTAVFRLAVNANGI